LLTLPEKVLFVLAALVSAYFTTQAVLRFYRTIRRGNGSLDRNDLAGRLFQTLYKTLSQETVLRSRLLPSIAHAFVAWAFMFYLFVNIGDGLEGFFSNFVFLGHGLVGNLYRLIADVLSVGALVGMTALIIRRLTSGRGIFVYRKGVTLSPKAATGIRRDSLIVGVFILFHVGFRFVGSSFRLAETGGPLPVW
jgi:hypothetical protein